MGASGPMRSPNRWLHYVGLGLAGLLGMIALASKVSPAVSLFPPCPIQGYLGIPSPSCGLTRAVMALARGDFQLSLWYHLFGLPIVLLIVVWAILAVLDLTGRRSLTAILSWRGKRGVMVGSLIVFFIYYGIRLAAFKGVELPWHLSQHSIWIFLKTGAEAL